IPAASFPPLLTLYRGIPMKVPPEIWGLAKFAPQEHHRYDIASILFDMVANEPTAVVTDGRVALAVSWKLQGEPLGKRCIVPRKLCLMIARQKCGATDLEMAVND